MKADNQIGQTYSAINRRTFTNEKFSAKPHTFSTTAPQGIFFFFTLRFNWKNIPKDDETLSAWTYKYGAQTM